VIGMTQADQRHEPKFSILLPTHNRADVLPFAIRSVLGQTLPDFELLIVGDGCTDDTAEVVKSFSDSRIRWFDLPKAPNFGYANRNLALREARGELVAFMAHDDLWMPDHLELLLPLFERSEVELAYSRPLWVIPNGLLAPGTFNLEYGPTMKAFLSGANSIPAACVVHRRDCFAKYGYWNDELTSCGDRDLWARIIAGGNIKNFAYLAEPTCLHFRANWRTEATDQPQLRVWKQLHSLKDFIPAELKIAVANGATEQEAVWLAMSAQPGEWPQRIRSAVRQALDRRITQSDDLMLALVKRDPSLKVDVAGMSEPLAQIAPVLRFAENGLEWKVARLLIAAKRRAVPIGSLRQRIWSRLVRPLHS
jgi:glycosyltransferase involved in cell wall biosynthesis